MIENISGIPTGSGSTPVEGMLMGAEAQTLCDLIYDSMSSENAEFLSVQYHQHEATTATLDEQWLRMFVAQDSDSSMRYMDMDLILSDFDMQRTPQESHEVHFEISDDGWYGHGEFGIVDMAFLGVVEADLLTLRNHGDEG